MAAVLAPATLLASRVALPVLYAPRAGGSRLAAVPLLYVLPVLAAIFVAVADRDTVRSVLGQRWAWVGPACLGLDVAVYVYSGWAERSAALTAALSLPFLASVASLVVGAFLWRRRPWALHGLVCGSVIISALAGILQVVERSGFSTSPGRALLAWDVFAAEQLKVTLNFGRAEGFELNPNILAPMAIVGIIWALFVMDRGWLRTATVLSAGAIVITSQSRAALVAIAVLAVIAIVRRISESQSKRRSSAIVMAVLGVTLLALALAFVRYGPLSLERKGIVLEPSHGIEIPAASADQSFMDRVAVWKATARAIAAHPWGVGQDYRLYTKPLPHPHNEALFRMLYASPLWLAVHAVFILWLALWLQPPRYPWVGVAFASALFVYGLTEVLFTKRPFMVLLYLMIGAMMWAKTQGEPEQRPAVT